MLLTWVTAVQFLPSPFIALDHLNAESFGKKAYCVFLTDSWTKLMHKISMKYCAGQNFWASIVSKFVVSYPVA